VGCYFSASCSKVKRVARWILRRLEKLYLSQFRVWKLLLVIQLVVGTKTWRMIVVELPNTDVSVKWINSRILLHRLSVILWLMYELRLWPSGLYQWSMRQWGDLRGLHIRKLL
jgi:hypothetical protein